MQALKAGSFYASCGVYIDEITVDGNIIRIASQFAQEIKAITHGGAVSATTRSNSIEFDANSIEGNYIRFELFGIGSDMTWTQAFRKATS